MRSASPSRRRRASPGTREQGHRLDRGIREHGIKIIQGLGSGVPGKAVGTIPELIADRRDLIAGKLVVDQPCHGIPETETDDGDADRLERKRGGI